MLPPQGGALYPNKPTFYTANKNVAVPGTAEQLTAQPVPDGFGVVVKAKRTNTGYIYPGESKAQAEVHNVELAQKDSVTLYVKNTNAIWVDSSVAGEGVEIIVEAD